MGRGENPHSRPLLGEIANQLRKPLGMLAVTAAFLVANPAIEAAAAHNHSKAPPVVALQPEADNIFPDNLPHPLGALVDVVAGLAIGGFFALWKRNK